MQTLNDPPDKRCVKCLLKAILKNPKHADIFADASFRSHQMVIQVYQFLRLWILHKYHNGFDIPKLTKATFTTAFSALKMEWGKQPTENAKLYQEFKQFLLDECQTLNFNPIDCLYLAPIFAYLATDMLTNVETNIKRNFIKYVKRFVNSSLNATNKELNQVKEDLINQTLSSDPKFHDWIQTHQPYIFPVKKIKNYEADVEIHPQPYLKGMIYMCLEIETLGTKSFQFFPLRNGTTTSFIPIDSNILAYLLIDNVQVRKKYAKILDIRDELWNIFFNLQHPILKQTQYQFDYRIQTDGYSISLQMTRKDQIEAETAEKRQLQAIKNESHALYQTMTPAQKRDHQQDQRARKESDLDNFQMQKQALAVTRKMKFDKLPQDEKDKIILAIKRRKAVYPYLENLTTEEYDQLQNSRWCVVDPGTRDLLHIKGEGIAFGRQERLVAKKKAQAKKAGLPYQNSDQLPRPQTSGLKTFKYTRGQYFYETKRFEHQRKLQNYRKEEGILDIERHLSDLTSKTCQLVAFKDFIRGKNKANQILLDKYNRIIFRKYKWLAFINKRKAESKLVHTIKSIYGKHIVLCYGDWSKGEMPLKTAPVPGLGLKRMLAQHFRLYQIDEFRTSCLSHKTYERCGHLSTKGREIHSVLTHTVEKKRKGCINRDENATYNMVTIVRQFLKDRSRPYWFRRGVKVGAEPKHTIVLKPRLIINNQGSPTPVFINVDTWSQPEVSLLNK
jgi:hypothetical protein